jgi:hypothetical protein
VVVSGWLRIGVATSSCQWLSVFCGECQLLLVATVSSCQWLALATVSSYQCLSVIVVAGILKRCKKSYSTGLFVFVYLDI